MLRIDGQLINGDPNLPCGVSQSDIDDPDYADNGPMFSAKETAGYWEYVRAVAERMKSEPSPIIPCEVA